MAKRSQDKADMNHTWAVAVKSEKSFIDFTELANSRGLLPLSKKQVARLGESRYFADAIETDGMDLIASRGFTSSKPVNASLYTVGLPAEPLREASLASQNIQSTLAAYHVLGMLREARNETPDIYTYMVTLTTPNSDKGHFDAEVKKLLASAGKFMKALVDGTSRGNGLVLEAQDGTQANFVGGIRSLEVTVNEKKLQAKSQTGLFHPHIHAILMVDKPLKIGVNKDHLFDKWHQLTPTASKKAFKLEAAFDKTMVNQPVRNGNATVGALKESVKYSLKPDILKRLNPKRGFDVECFAEIVRGLKGHKIRQSYGELLEAKVFMKSEFSFIMNSFLMSDATQRMPDFYTLKGVLMSLPNGLGPFNAKTPRTYLLTKVQAMTDGEIYIHNQDFFKNLFLNEDAVQGLLDDFNSGSLARLMQSLKDRLNAGGLSVKDIRQLKRQLTNLMIFRQILDDKAYLTAETYQDRFTAATKQLQREANLKYYLASMSEGIEKIKVQKQVDKLCNKLADVENVRGVISRLVDHDFMVNARAVDGTKLGLVEQSRLVEMPIMGEIVTAQMNVYQRKLQLLKGWSKKRQLTSAQQKLIDSQKMGAEMYLDQYQDVLHEAEEWKNGQPAKFTYDVFKTRTIRNETGSSIMNHLSRHDTGLLARFSTKAGGVQMVNKHGLQCLLVPSLADESSVLYRVLLDWQQSKLQKI